MDEEPSQGAETMTKNALDKLEKSIDNVMTDEDVEQVLSLVERIKHQYEGDEPSKVPALENADVTTSMLAEDALMNGIVTDTTYRHERDTSRVTIEFAIPHNVGTAQNYQYDYDNKRE